MQTKKVLVTGGAGFIASHLVDALVEKGHEVKVLDNLEPQVHEGKKPEYLNAKAEYIWGDVRKPEDLKKALQGAEVVFHEAAAVGVGQSMYQIRNYIETNTQGTANLLDFLANEKHSVEKVIVAASMSSYGEGAHECETCGGQEVETRSEERLREKKFEHACPQCGKELKAIPTPETKRQNSTSIYAQSKKHQEEMVLLVGKTYGIPTVALRYFNVFGPRQSLSNPYTGVAAIFLSRVKNNNAPVIYEDGMQMRDFISVHDIVQANLLAMEQKSANFESFNVGSGKPYSVKEIAQTIIALNNAKLEPKITFEPRKGDIRHCFANISKIKSRLGFEPKVSFEAGMKELMQWSKNVQAKDRFEAAARELKSKGLV
ncbi:MAG: SDR family NAD(P)-dependent oxidoreductase [Candidatus Diapherotrites archaeon]